MFDPSIFSNYFNLDQFPPMSNITIPISLYYHQQSKKIAWSLMN